MLFPHVMANDVETEKHPLIYECHANALDGGFGVGRSTSKAKAYKTAVFYCRAYSRVPQNCKVYRCINF